MAVRNKSVDKRTTTRVIGKNKGLNNKIAPEYLPLTSTGFDYVAQAVNMDSDNSGQLRVRNGFRETSITTPSHSLFSNNEIGLFVTGDALCLINLASFETKPIRRVTPGARMSYLDAPPGRVYYTNGYEKGVVTEGVSQDWIMSDPIIKDGQTPFNPPTGHTLEVFGGYVFVACKENEKNVVYHSMPFSPNSFDFGKAFFVFPSEITMMAGVDNGLYVGTRTDMYFLSGNNPNEFTQKKICSLSPLKGSCVKTNTKHLGMEEDSNCVMFAANSGIYGAFNNGSIIDFTEKNIELHDEYLYADAYIKDGKYIVSFNK